MLKLKILGFLKHRRIVSLGLAAISVLMCLSLNSWAQSTFPSKAIRIIVPNAAGGAADISARSVAQKLSERLGQPVLIDNKPSAGGILAAELVSHAEPDGYTLLLISSGTAVSAALFKNLPFDTVKDFQPISKMASFDLIIASAPNGRFKNYSDLLVYAKANPGRLNIVHLKSARRKIWRLSILWLQQELKPKLCLLMARHLLSPQSEAVRSIS